MIKLTDRERALLGVAFVFFGCVLLAFSLWAYFAASHDSCTRAAAEIGKSSAPTDGGGTA